jgi:D-alanine-D-alanine ligase
MQDNSLLSFIGGVLLQFKKVLKNNNEVIQKYINSISVVLIAHVLGPRGYDNINQLNCSETEHFTVQEFDEIYQGIINAGFFIRKVFFNEFDFVKDVSTNTNEYSETIIFNLCRNGTGMNKKTLTPAICDLLRIAYTSSSAGSSALARNKLIFSSYLNANDVFCPISVCSVNEFKNRLPLNSRVIYKPNHGSASQNVGDKNICEFENIPHEYKEGYFFQEYIDGYECEVPIFCSLDECVALSPVGISFKKSALTGILSFEDSMNNNYSFYDLSKILGKDICNKIMADAIKAFNLLGLEIYGRVDFRIDKKTKQHFIIDVSTTPYITKHSSFAFAVELNGGIYTDIFKLIITASLLRNYSYKEKN